MNFSEYLKHNIVYLDGGMGTLLQAQGLAAGEHPEKWNIYHPEVIKEIHKAYYDAGSNVVSTNTFGANSLKFSDPELAEIIKAAIDDIIIDVAVFLKSSFIYASSFYHIIA